MNKPQLKLYLLATSMAAVTTLLTACGGSSESTAAASETSHPRFSRVAVAVSSVYQPTGIITDSTPTFSWKMIENATKYRLGHEDTDTETRWHEYIVTPSKANCSTQSNCSYTPSDMQFSNGDEKVWWVQAMVAGQWKNWSDAYVFKYDAANPQTKATPISPAGKIPTTSPKFTWTNNIGADSYHFGYESADESNWTSFTLTPSEANCQNRECSYLPATSSLKNGDLKTWWVRSQTSGVWSNWSRGSSFSIDDPSIPPPSGERPMIMKIDSHVTTCQMFVGCRSEEKFTILSGGTSNGRAVKYDVDCDSDGVNEATDVTGSYTCKYSSQGVYRVTLSGNFPHIKTKKVTEIEQWGTQKWSSMESAFTFPLNLKISATDNPDLSLVKSTANMFSKGGFDSDLKNQNVSNWDVSNVTDMNNMFREARNFNQDIGSWDVSNVTDMKLMFFAANNFNQDIGNWDVSKVKNMQGMFMSASKFNQDIGNWNVSNVTEIKDMFNYASDFNQDIGHWDVSNITNMERLFSGTALFNQDIGNWDVSNVTNMSSLFAHASVFNQDVSHWDVSNVTNMSAMFSYAKAFNQPIGSWDVSKVTDMSLMLEHAASFNQAVGSWNVSNVTDMYELFQEASVFNQDLSNWDVGSVKADRGRKGMNNILENTALSIANYDKLLIAWSQLQLSNNITLGAQNIKYSSAGTVARQKLINDFKWVISDGGVL